MIVPSRWRAAPARVRSGPPAAARAGSAGHRLSGISPAARANACRALATAGCCRGGSLPKIPAISARRRAVAWLTTCLPAAVMETCTARRSARARCRRISPLRTSLSHIRPAVEGVTASAAARAAIRCGPREASTTSARYWAIVVSSAAAPSDMVATATSVRLAVSTASTAASSTRCSATPLPVLLAYCNYRTMTLSSANRVCAACKAARCRAVKTLDWLGAVVRDHIAGLLADPPPIRAEISKRLDAARTSDPVTSQRTRLQAALAKATASVPAMIEAFSEQPITIDELRAPMPTFVPGRQPARPARRPRRPERRPGRLPHPRRRPGRLPRPAIREQRGRGRHGPMLGIPDEYHETACHGGLRHGYHGCIHRRATSGRALFARRTGVRLLRCR